MGRVLWHSAANFVQLASSRNQPAVRAAGKQQAESQGPRGGRAGGGRGLHRRQRLSPAGARRRARCSMEILGRLKRLSARDGPGHQSSIGHLAQFPVLLTVNFTGTKGNLEDMVISTEPIPLRVDSLTKRFGIL